MNFRYKARDPLNRVVTGELEGTDAAGIERELEGRALTPIWIRQANAPQTTSASILDALGRDDIEDVPEKSASGVGWGTSIFILIYILLQIFGLL